MESSSLTERISKLSPAKRALFEAKLKANGAALSDLTVTRRPDGESAPLSFAQQRLWFLNQLEPEGFAYNESNAVRLRGDLDLSAFEKALNQIVARHEVLRTTIVTIDGKPRQMIADKRKIELTIADLKGLAEAERESAAQRLMDETIRKPFDLSRDLMLRVFILQLVEREQIFLVVKHHIASDGWSSGIFWRELKVLYREFTSGRPSLLPELPVQYADYAVWQRQWLQGEVLASQLSYWKKQLEGIPALLNLSTDRPRKAVSSYKGARHKFELTKELSDRLKQLSRLEGVTLFMTLLAAFQTLLHRYAGQDDIVVGTPIANRNRSEIEGLIGFFANTLVLRSDFSGNPTFKQLLARMRETALGAYAHQDLPFEKLVEELKPERSLSHSPLFQVMFALQNATSVTQTLEGLDVSPVSVGSETAKFDLTLSLRQRDEGISGYFEYATELFNAATISRMARHFHVLLDAIVANPDHRVGMLDLMDAAERRQIVSNWSATGGQVLAQPGIHRLFERQVARRPTAMAAIYNGSGLSYADLNGRANQLAHYLRGLGVGPDTLVGICVERSLEMAVGILGILKAGGAYVPLDPTYPQERLAFMLRDSKARVVLAHERSKSKLPPHDAQVVRLDADWPAISRQSETNPNGSVDAEQLAYVIYTSGSTGQPKGVLITHGGLVNHASAIAEHYRLGDKDRVSQCNLLSFDISVEELFATWISGAALVLCPPEKFLPDEVFANWTADEKITVLNLPTAFWHGWVHTLESRQRQVAGNLRLVVCGGDKAAAAVLAKWRELAGPEIRWINAYGPTEATVTSTVYDEPFCPVADTAGGEIPIGRPIAGTQAWILDAGLQLVPPGLPGELYIGGAGLSRGYLNHPELTSEHFIPNPFSNQPGTRLYRTGDFCRYLSDGNIEFLGRRDHQVKFRGFRIEPGEIEATLNRYPGVQESVVLIQQPMEIGLEEASTTDKNNILANQQTAAAHLRLFAYVVRRPESRPTTTELRIFLKRNLPPYMIPSAFLWLDRLPLTANGKLDRLALPEPAGSAQDFDDQGATPRDDIEQRLTAIWQSLLATHSISVKENFFDLGGHSLLAVNLFIEIEKSFNRRLPLATIFQSPTIEQLAKILRSEEGEKSPYSIWSTHPSCIVPLQPNGSKPPLYWFNWGRWDIRLPNYLDSDQPVYGIKHQAQDGERARYDRIEDIAAYYITEIQTIQSRGPYFLGGLCIGGMVAFEMAQQLKRQGHEVALLALLDPTKPRPNNAVWVAGRRQHRLSRLQSIRSDLTRHWQQLSALGYEEKKHYLKARATGRFLELARTVHFFTRSILCEAFGSPLPPSLRSQYIFSIYGRAIAAYAPQTYRGRVILFKTRERYRDDKTGWETLVPEGLVVVDLDTDHDHVFQEPYVESLAASLNTYLSHAATAVASQSNQNLVRIINEQSIHV